MTRTVALLLAAGCTVGETPSPVPGADAGSVARVDAARSDAGTFDCDPLATGIFVTGNAIEGTDARRVLGNYHPTSNTFTELADVRSCIEGWYVRAMAVSRDGVVHFLLANQTMAIYGIEDGTCEVRPLSRSLDDGLYALATLAGDGSGSLSPADERLFVTFGSFDAGDQLLIELDRGTFAETTRATIPTGDALLISLAGTSDGRLFATRSRGASEPIERDVVQVASDGAMTSVARIGPRPDIVFRTAVALWDSRAFLFDAVGTPSIESTITEVDLRTGSASAPLLTLRDFELQAVATTTCVSLTFI
jgi:hypothetical protein